MATHSNVRAWRIPETAEPGGLPSMGSHRVRHDLNDLAAHCEASNNTLAPKGAVRKLWGVTSQSYRNREALEGGEDTKQQKPVQEEPVYQVGYQERDVGSGCQLRVTGVCSQRCTCNKNDLHQVQTSLGNPRKRGAAAGWWERGRAWCWNPQGYVLMVWVTCIQSRSFFSKPWAFLVAQLLKNLPATQETLVRFLGWENPLEKG